LLAQASYVVVGIQCTLYLVKAQAEVYTNINIASLDRRENVHVPPSQRLLTGTFKEPAKQIVCIPCCCWRSAFVGASGPLVFIILVI
jgi:hypothetical protein